jgi:hypothetical protein
MQGMDRLMTRCPARRVGFILRGMAVSGCGREIRLDDAGMEALSSRSDAATIPSCSIVTTEHACTSATACASCLAPKNRILSLSHLNASGALCLPPHVAAYLHLAMTLSSR